MRDKLTKKRIKVDYALVIEIAGLSQEFFLYLQAKKSRISFNRLGLAFCKAHKVDVERIYYSCLNSGYKTLKEYNDECIRLAQDHSCWKD